ncbi:hypothetical protein VZT92_003238 [Zoarces viviparus]|uniref:Protein FAM161A n=1 Tax=Zoarces viviparus TaxID=48416 RepID=A0AAW1G0L4_ZOAVI
MANPHRTNVLVTSCLSTPVDPHTRAPLASYERPRGYGVNRDHEKELEYEDSGSDVCDEVYVRRGVPHMTADYRAPAGLLDLSEIFFSNEEYCSKLEELKEAHLRTMAELESMYRRKLRLKAMEPLGMTVLETGGLRLPWSDSSPAASRRLKKSHSAIELRRGSGQSDSSDEDEDAINDVEKHPIFSPKEHIRNMWRDFKLSPHNHHMSSSSLRSMPADRQTQRKGKGRKRWEHEDGEQELWKHRLTIPQPFQMMLREAERQKHRTKTRTEIEQENTELQRQLEELTECERKFRAAPVPAHVHLPLYQELQEREEERRRTREREDQHLRSTQKPFSFLERERLKKEQKQLHPQQPSGQEKVNCFKAKPVPKAVHAAVTGEQMKEEQLYRSIKIQMRAQEMLYNASMPPSMLARQLSDRKKTNDDRGDNFSHRPHINTEVPDFDAIYRRFQRHLEKQRYMKPTTVCEPFTLRTSRIPSHRERIAADIEKEQSGPRMPRWPYVSPGPSRRADSRRCSSLSGSMEVLPTKVTDASKKREEAVRKVLEQRKKADEEEELRKERQKQREKELQRVVFKRAEANDPHLALSQTHPTKLREFRKQELQRKKEYQQEIKEMQQRVEERPLLLEQFVQRNAKQAAEKRYTDAVHRCDLTEEFISSKAAKWGAARETSTSSDNRHSDPEEPDMGYEPVHYGKLFLDDGDAEATPDRRDGGSRRSPLSHRDGEDDDSRCSEESCHYSDDHENYSDDSEHDARQQEAGE